METAMDQSDRTQALVAWAGPLCAGPIVPAVILALNWSKRDSLARRQAMLATIMWVAVLSVYVPFVIRMAANGEPDAVFWLVWSTVNAFVAAMTIVNVIRVWRATIDGVT